VDPDVVEAKIKAVFADIPAPKTPLVKKPDLIPDNEEPIVGVVTDPEANSSSAYLMWKMPAIPVQFRNTDMVFVSRLLESVINRVMSERLNTISSKPDAPFIGAGAGFEEICESCQAFVGSVVYANGGFDTAFKAFQTEIEKMRRYGFTDSEVSRAKDEILSRFEKAATGADTRKNAAFVGPLISNFFQNDPYPEPQTAYDLAKQILPMLSAQAVNKTVSGLITDKNVVIIVNSPLLEGLAVPSEAQILALYNETRQSETAPDAEEKIDSQFVDPASLKGGKVKKTKTTYYGATQWTLSNGVEVCVLPTEYKKDQLLLRFYKDGGTGLVSDEDMKSFDSDIISLWQRYRGVSKYPCNVVDKMLSGKQVDIYPLISDNTSSIQGSCQPKDLETALQLIYLEFTDPRFDKDEYTTAVTQIKAFLPNLEKTPSFEFSKQMNNTIMANKERNTFISVDKVENASFETIEKVYRSLLDDTAGARLLVVGNVNLDELKPLVEKYIGSLPRGKHKRTVKDVDDNYVQGKVDNHFQFAMTTPKASVGHFYNSSDIEYNIDNEMMLKAADYILDMIYVDVIREEQGGTYGVSTSMSIKNFPARAVIQFYFDTNVESAWKLAAMASEELVKLAQDGPSEDYLNRTIEHFKKSIPESRINNEYWLNNLAYNYRYGVDRDALNEQAISKITAESIKAIVQKVLASGNDIEIIMTPAE